MRGVTDDGWRVECLAEVVAFSKPRSTSTGGRGMRRLSLLLDGYRALLELAEAQPGSRDPRSDVAALT